MIVEPAIVERRRGGAELAAVDRGRCGPGLSGSLRLEKVRQAPLHPEAGRGLRGRPAQPPQTVRVAPVITGDMPLTIDALGMVTPFETVTIRTQIAGTLQNVGFTEGQIVKQGDFIAQIDPRPYGRQARRRANWPRTRLYSARLKRPRPLSAARQAGLIAQQQVGRPDCVGRAGQSGDCHRPGMVKTAELNVAYTHIVSPVTGRWG